MKFKVGDRIKMKEDCGSSLRKGEVLTVKADYIGRLYAAKKGGFCCFHSDLWLPITDVISKESLVAGETVIVEGDGDESLVLEVGETSFLRSYCGAIKSAYNWFTFTEANAKGWKIKLPPEQETITHEGKKYDKKAFEEKLKELKPIE